MKLYELSQLPFKERFKFVNDFTKSDLQIYPDVRIVNDIFINTIEWFQKGHYQREENLISKLKDPIEVLPSMFKSIYEIKEKYLIKELPANERQRIFDDFKEAWCLHYPEFQRISTLMQNYHTNETLIEYRRQTSPAFIHDKAIEIYKKCILFKVKLTKKVLSPLRNHPDQLEMWCHYVPYCIDKEIVKIFLKEYQKWNFKITNFWNEIYYLNQDFFFNKGYKWDWDFYIKHSHLLKEKADEIQNSQENILSLFISGEDLLNNFDNVITLEYKNNSSDMSLYERELEILRINEGLIPNDEEYCYVYTLECELFVFYVGIAADPKGRFEQHIKGAFSDEAHLFKSKFIQKYHNEIKQNIIFEGTRKECRKFERYYINENNPLGNMTTGGEG